LSPQYPSVALLNWTTGEGTARLWVLKLMIDEIGPGFTLPNTSTTQAAPGNGADPFCGTVLNLETLNLQCVEPTATISQIQFASYGTPTGTCGSYQVGSCNAANSTSIVQSYCIGKNSCSVPATTPIFGDPCYGTVKNLVVQAHCSSGGGFQPAPAPVHSQAFVAPDGTRKVLIINKDYNAHVAALPGATGGVMKTIDEATAFGPARVESVTSDNIPLAPYAVVVVTMPN
jgi:hypothetical protein